MEEPKINQIGAEIKRPDEVATRNQIESAEKIPMKVNDLRETTARSFNLEKFLNMIERLRKERLFKISMEFKDSDYGKYMSCFASSESDHWADAVKNAKAIEITLTTSKKNFGIQDRIGGTDVEVKILMGEKEGRIFRFRFNNQGNYSGAGWDDVHFQKRLREGEGQDFNLEIEPNLETKKLE